MNELLQTVTERLAVEDVNGAWRAIQTRAADTQTGHLLAAIAEAAEAKWHPPLPEIAQRAAGSTHSPQALGALGSALVSVGEARLAADLLGRAIALVPGDPHLLAEQVAALELFGDHSAALHAIVHAPATARADTTIAYLHAFHLLVDGRVEAAAAREIPDGPQAAYLRERIATRIARARAIGLGDPRARILSIAGTLPLRVSAEPTSEDPAQTATRIAELGAALRGLGLAPDHVAYLPTSGSAQLAARIAEHLGLSSRLYQGPGALLPLLVVVDLADISTDRAADLRSRDGIVLYAHLARSTREHPIAPDLLGTYAPAVTLEAGSPPSDEPPGLFGYEHDSEGSLPFDGPLPTIPVLPEEPLAMAWASAPPPARPCTPPRDRLWAGLGPAT